MKYNWTFQVIRNADDAKAMVQNYLTHQPDYGVLDTETTGLHIILDTPFLFQFGWINVPTLQGWAYCVDLEQTPKLARQVIFAALDLFKRLKLLVGHNLKYDLHMLKNIGFEYRTENMSDTMFYIRYAHDALTEDKGGPPMQLKPYAARFVDRMARFHEQKLDAEKTAIMSQLNNQLYKVFLKGRHKKDLEPFFADALNDPSELPPADYAGYQQWLAWLPPWIKGRFNNVVESDNIPYNVLNRDNVQYYGMMDIALTLETLMVTMPVLESRCNTKAVGIENSLILPLLDMERVGFEVNVPYLQESKATLKQYIRERRAHFHELAGEKITIGQHARVKDILAIRFGIVCESTQAAELSRLQSDLIHAGENPSAVDFIQTLQDLRTLEKWYGTYVLRFLRGLSTVSRLYTTINSVGTVSGRVTSDFQQFPKGAIKGLDNRELFNPRRMVTTSGEDYPDLVYLDYSQIELRLQAIYTILIEHPEPNLLRAYMPYHCHDANGCQFAPENPEHIQRWKEPWYLDESPGVPWTPTDVHAGTTCYAFNVTPEDPNFKALRSIGKTLNFAKNYGAQLKRVREMFPKATEEEVQRINNAYYLAFPGVKAYHEYCYELARQQSWAINLFGVRYYGVSGHNLINILIQGSGAFFLKWKIRQLWEYSQAHNIKSRMQMNIHDEISWERHKSEGQVFFEFKKIMEDWADTLVPIVAEMEATHSTWANKKLVHSVEDFA